MTPPLPPPPPLASSPARTPGRGNPVAVHRIEVFAKPGRADPAAAALKRDAAAIGVELSAVRTAHVYLIQAALDEGAIDVVRDRLLTDPVTEASVVGATPADPRGQRIEVHPLPGVMDPVAQTVQESIRELVGVDARVSTGWRYDLSGTGLNREQVDRLAERFLANPVIQRVHHEPYHPAAFPVGQSHETSVRSIPLLALSDDELTRLSREAHLFLSLEEMKAIQAHYRGLGRDPREIELETLAQTWSEHCVHKTLKSTVTYREGAQVSRCRGVEGEPAAAPVTSRHLDTSTPRINWGDRPGHKVNPDGSVTINNLLKSTVAAATHALIKDGTDWTLSVFVDNAGVIEFDEKHAVCVKVETHNHPSAIEPYGGAATGAGGCIRDVIGTGLAAQPVANTDVFCVAMPTGWEEVSRCQGAEVSRAPGSPLPGHLDSSTPRHLPPGTLHPRRILSQVVAGVRDYGNRMGIPTVSGAVAFDDRYVGNPLVFCGCIGVMPRDRIKGRVREGDLIVALGGRTGRDGIHGATFSSAELEHTSADEFAHAVQIGNAIEEKRLLDAILRARDEGKGGPLFSALTDCGAGGFSSAVGEMAKETGAVVRLDAAPLKYAGLSATEIWISEAQERMVLAVPAGNLDAIKQISREESVELAVLGEFRSPGGGNAGPDLQLLFHGEEVGRLSMEFLHDGIPTPRRAAEWGTAQDTAHSTQHTAHSRKRAGRAPGGLVESLLRVLSHPNVASKHWIIRQYDHEVRGATVIKPLVGAALRGPSDASVIQPIPGSRRGLAISQGLQTGIGDPALGGDPYLMALAAVDECVRNLVCVGADPERIAILDNFCWPSCAKPRHLGALVRAAEGCYDAALAYRTPFVSGKDSLNNQLTYTDPTTGEQRTIEIPYTLLITGIGIVPDVARCVTMDAKRAGNVLLLVGGCDQAGMGGSVYQLLFDVPEAASSAVPRTDLELGPRAARKVAGLIRAGLVASAHDVSEGGLLTAVAEMLIGGMSMGGALGAEIRLPGGIEPTAAAFAESPSRYVLEVTPRDRAAVTASLGDLPCVELGALTARADLVVNGERCGARSLLDAWERPLDW